MRQIAYIGLILLIIHPAAHSQDKKVFKNTFLEGEYFMMTEEYAEAIHYFTELLKLDPDNANLHFLTGACYLSLYGEKHKAIPYLERAVQDVSMGYREGSYKERGAPRESIFALARAYHIDGQFDRAIEQYITYKNVMFKRHFADIEYVNQQVKSCERAKGMITRPVKVNMLDIGPTVNRNPGNYNPVVSMNDSMIIYMYDKKLYRAIMMSRLGEGGWSVPRDITSELGSDGNCYPTCLSRDGKELYLARRDYLESDIYISRLTGDHWTTMEPLNDNINTKYYESHASISLDGRKLLFTSDRPEGQGGLDIWLSEYSPGGDWGPPVNLGPRINSHYNEESPFFTENGRKIYFSSQGHATMGGYDIFYSDRLPDATWSFPENIGFPVSTPDDDLFYLPRSNGWRGYYATTADSLTGRRMIYAVYHEGIEDLQIAVRRQGEVAHADIETETAVPAGAGDTLPDAGDRPRETLSDTLPEELIIPGPVETGAYFVLNSIMFDFDSDVLSADAKEEADRVYEVMKKYPSIHLELTGHTDAVGSTDYNQRLSHMRANTVANYLIDRGVDSNRLQVTGIGESNPIALNVYEDGTDCPDGRRLNRHVSLKLRNLQDQQVEVAGIFVPDRLRPRSEMRYSILLIESPSILDTIPGEIAGEKTAMIITQDTYLYIAGNFDRKPDAMRYLNEVIDQGYPDAGMLEKRELERLIEGISQGEMSLEAGYTIQVMALKKPVETSYFFPLEVTKIAGPDGFHRYIYGDYGHIDEALDKLPSIRSMGYEDAFIMNILRYRQMSE